MPGSSVRPEVGPETLTFRAALPDDVGRIVAIINDPPPAEGLRIAGSEAKLTGATALLIRRRISVRIDQTTLAELDGMVVGVMDAGAERGEVRVTPMLVAQLLGPMLTIIGPAGALRLLRSRAHWARVSFDAVPGAYYISELDVDSRYRNRGLGGALLRLAEQRARAEGCARMALTTAFENPARRLYERHGFRVIEERHDAEFARHTGSRGRVLMVTELA